MRLCDLTHATEYRTTRLSRSVRACRRGNCDSISPGTPPGRSAAKTASACPVPARAPLSQVLQVHEGMHHDTRREMHATAASTAWTTAYGVLYRHGQVWVSPFLLLRQRHQHRQSSTSPMMETKKNRLVYVPEA